MDMISMAKAYLQITEEMGPSEQLLAFVNFDKGLEEEIGLEGYNTFSMTARHEILANYLQKIISNEEENNQVPDDK